MTATDLQLQEGMRLHQAGRLPDAEAVYRRILDQDPDHAEALRFMGVLAGQAGQPDLAIQLVQRSVAICPASAAAHNSLGGLLGTAGRMEEAIIALREAAFLEPKNSQIQYNLGTALLAVGQTPAAAQAFRKAAQLRPNFAEAWSNLGAALQRMLRFDEAIEACDAALQLNSRYFEAWYNLANACRAKGRLDEAIVAYQKGLELRPGSAGACTNLGAALLSARQIDAAAHWSRRALQLDPTCAEAHANLGNCLKEQGQIEAAIPCFRRAVALAPESASLRSALVYALNYDPQCDDTSLQAEIACWNEHHAQPDRPEHSHAVVSSPSRLRIGYVSPDFYEHVVGQNILPLLREHDREFAEIICYSSGEREDPVTAKCRALCDKWRDIRSLSDDAAAELIRADGVDILVDLSLHTSGNRLGLFARKPAPIQVSYLGYCGATGLEAIDFRLSDPYLDPLETDLDRCREETIRLPRSYWCYEPLGPMPETNTLPALDQRRVTFGCLNNFAKVSASVLELWAALLMENFESRLLLHAPEGSCRELALERFRRLGISPDRVDFVGRLPWVNYVQAWQRIDIGLDPFPYGGGITTCDALWLGVPVVSLSGRTAVGRSGDSILNNVGLSELVAQSPLQYLSIAGELARDLPRLKEMRAGLRARMECSPLRDARGFAREMEAAYREMLRRRARCQ